MDTSVYDGEEKDYVIDFLLILISRQRIITVLVPFVVAPANLAKLPITSLSILIVTSTRYLGMESDATGHGGAQNAHG